MGAKPKDQKELNELYKEGEERYTNLVPPGYKDKKDKETKDKFTYANLTYIPMYGDLIIWKQILAKASDDDIDSVIFITDDAKEDWQYIIDSNGKKTIGARSELRDEIYTKSKVKSFEILQTTDFMQSGQEFLELTLKKESINEVKLNLELLKSIEERKEKVLQDKLRLHIENEKRRLEKIHDLQRRKREYEEELRFDREMEWRYEQEVELREERDEERKREYEEDMRHEKELEWRYEQEEEMRRDEEEMWRKVQDELRGL